jgi:hypothetical protein
VKQLLIFWISIILASQVHGIEFQIDNETCNNWTVEILDNEATTTCLAESELSCSVERYSGYNIYTLETIGQVVIKAVISEDSKTVTVSWFWPIDRVDGTLLEEGELINAFIYIDSTPNEVLYPISEYTSILLSPGDHNIEIDVCDIWDLCSGKTDPLWVTI